MASSGQAFPVDQFLNCIQNRRNTSHEFIAQANKLNIQWIYEILKHCHNLIADLKEMPEIKLSALQMIRDIIQTVQIPCINLVQVYILPMIYQIVIQKPQQKIQKRAASYFQQQAKMSKNQNYQQVGVKFLRLCEEMIYVCALIKPKRIFENQELNQKSEFKECYQKMQKYQIIGIPKVIQDIKKFSPPFLQNGRAQYLNNLATFSKNNEQYYEYFVTKILQSLDQPSNPLFNNGNINNSPSADLDMRKLLKQGDTYINTPLIDQLLIKIKISDNFAARKNCISLFTDFIKWGDAEALWKVCDDDSFFQVGKRILQVQGQNGLAQGENIYPQVKGQRQLKRKFYTQYLKSLQVASKCLQNCSMNMPNMDKIIDLYDYTKKQKKFQFPQNLMTKKIDSDFQQNIKINKQRNSKILTRLSQISRSGYQKSKISKNSKLTNINQDMEECLQQFLKLTENKQMLANRMKKLTAFKQNFHKHLNQMEQDNLKEQQIQQVIDNGVELTKNIEKLQKLYRKYVNREINYAQFQQQHEILLKDYDIDEEKSQQGQAQKSNILKTNQPLNLNKQQNPKPNMPIAVEKVQSKIQRPPTFANTVMQTPFVIIPFDDINTKTSPNFILTQIDGFAKKQFQQEKLNQKKYITVQKDFKNYSQKKNVISTSAQEYQLGAGNQIEQKIKIKQNWSSILKLEGQDQVSKLSNTSSQRKKSYSKIIQGSTLRQRVNKHKKQKEERNSKIQFKQASQISHPALPYQQLMVTNSHQGSQQLQDIKPIVEYFDYRSPESFKIVKPNSTHENFVIKNYSSLQQENKYFGATMPNNLTSAKAKVSISSGNNKQQQQNNNQNRIIEQKSLEMSNVQNTTQNKQIKQQMLHHSKKYQHNINNLLNENSKQLRLYNSTFGGEKKGVRQQYGDQFPNTMPLTEKENKLSMWQELPQNYVIRNTYISNIQKSKLSNSQSVPPSKLASLKGSQQKYQNPKEVYYSASHVTNYEQNYNNEDYIKQPNSHPLNNSYYGIEQIEKNIRSMAKPQFKQCFQINRQIIPSSSKRSRVFHNQQCSRNVEIHEQYLIAKLKRQFSSERQQETKILQNRILQLKTSNSKLRNKMSKKSNSSRENLSSSKFSEASKSSSSGKYVAFSNSKVSYSERPLSLKPASYIKSSNSQDGQPIMREGDLINVEIYQRYLMQLADQRLCKNCLRTKSIIVKNQLYEIGFMASYVEEMVKIIIYFTPLEPISNLRVSLAKEPNIQTQVYYKQYSQISSNKQVKIQVIAQLRNVPYSLPLMTLQFYKGKDMKNISFYLPISVNKFVRFSNTTHTQLENKLAISRDNFKATQQFIINPNVFKRKEIQSYFPNITSISANPSRIQKYVVGCSIKSNTFTFLVTLIGKEKMQLRTISTHKNIFAQYFMASLQSIIQAQ